MAWRYHAARPITNEWLDRDLQLNNVQVSWALSGPGELTATVDAITADSRDSAGRLVLDEWGTFIYAEENDIIRWGGILHSSVDAGNGSRSLTCTSFSGYPNGRLYTDFSDTGYRVYVKDAFDIIRYLWSWVQNSYNSNLGVQLNDVMSGYVMGSEDPGPQPVRSSFPTNAAYLDAKTKWQSAVNEPYVLAWWNMPDIGNEINNILTESRGEYIEYHTWTADKQSVVHRIDLSTYAGSRRDDLRFIEGENLIPAPLPDRDGTEYANYVLAVGAGEDRHTLKSYPETSDDGRLRRDAAAPAKGIYSPTLLQALAHQALLYAQDINKIDSITVVDHPNAPLGSWQLGDQIRVETYSGFIKLDLWLRIIGWSFDPQNPSQATISLARLED